MIFSKNSRTTFEACILQSTFSNNKPTNTQALKPMQKIIVMPKDPRQVSSSTKSDLVQVMNPVDINVQIEKLKYTRDGGVILGCSHLDSISKIK